MVALPVVEEAAVVVTLFSQVARCRVLLQQSVSSWEEEEED